MDIQKNQLGISPVSSNSEELLPDKKITAKPSSVENGEEKMAKALDCLAGQVPIVRTPAKTSVDVHADPKEPLQVPDVPSIPEPTLPEPTEKVPVDPEEPKVPVNPEDPELP